jgi:hydrogenase expression/formation protein HypE
MSIISLLRGDPGDIMDKTKPLCVGKIPDDALSEILGKYVKTEDERVLLGPALGEDAGVISMGNNPPLAVCVDPIIVNIKNAPYYAVSINVNDLVTRGAKPRWGAASVFIPEGWNLLQVGEFFKQTYDAAKAHNISIVTGHTEVTGYLKSPGIVLTLFGEIEGKVIRTSGAKEGDALILTGGAGIEGTAILASEFYGTLKEKVDEKTLKRAQDFIYRPGICVAEAAYIAWKYRPNALHDPTEGGVRKGIEEMAMASGNGVLIEYNRIPVLEETRMICEASGDDPLAIFGSGALLISIPQERSSTLMSEYRKKGIVAMNIGLVVSKEEGRNMFYNGKKIPLTASHIDGLIGRL